MKYLLCGVFCICLLAPLHAFAKPVAAEDLFKLKFVSSPSMSHGGKQVAFVVTTLDGPKNAYHSNIWLADAEGDRVWQLTRGGSDEDPQWSPDDRSIAFVSGRGEGSQIYRIEIAGGEAVRLTSASHGAESPLWSHDGSRIAFSATTVDETANSPVNWKAAGFTPDAKQRKTDVRTIDVLHFQDNGAGETYAMHPHIWTMRSDGSAAKALTQGHKWSEHGASWSSDDTQIAFDSYRSDDPSLFGDDIYVVPSASGSLRRLPLPHKFSEGPVWSKDGRQLWYFVASEPDPAGYPGVAHANSNGTDERVVVAENTVAFGDAILSDMREGGEGCGPLFEPSGRRFFAETSTPGATSIVRINTATGSQTAIAGGDAEITACSTSSDASKIAFVRTDATHPAELYVMNGDGSGVKQLSRLNAGYLSTVDLTAPDAFQVKDRAGFIVHAWIMHPPHFARGRRYPTILDIHGGPQTEFGNSFFHEFQYLAGLGYNVVYADPRGSVGFGYPFEAALSKNWGEPMFEDEMAVVDAAVARPEVDSGRLGVSGGSYGGYATLWMIGHTRRFRAAVAERAVSNLISQYLAADYASTVSARYDRGDPWRRFDAYWRQSPLAYVDRVTTPVLLLHSDNDIRTPVDQSVQEYSALKILGKTAQYVEFPRENHDLSRTGEPIHRVERLHIIADWLGKYLHP
ncbi:MAG: S9 family peptidase [Candidatus Eremiobacteraeota bacterium]|nr:S9 family peptidase [Candidatus Eremiobacteraeota bacterium]MBC5826541.1 S9 family peptidase [Candidatus Eremiobacteraeota bacterium]